MPDPGPGQRAWLAWRGRRCAGTAEGLDSLHNHPRSGVKLRLDDEQVAQLGEIVADGPDVQKVGLSAWMPAAPCRAR